MRLLLTSSAKDMRLVLRDPFGLLLWLGIPVMLLTLMNLAFGGGSTGGPKPRGILFIADQDGTMVSRMLGSAFGQGPMGEIFTVEQTTEQEGRRRLAKGDGSALVVVGKGFQSRILDNEPVTLTLVTNPTQSVLPAIAGETLKILAEGTHYIHLAAGGQIKQITGLSTGLNQAQFLTASLAVHRAIAEIRPYVDPPLLDVEFKTRVEEPKNTQPFNLTAIFFPGMMFMSLLFLTRGTSDGLWEELSHGTFQRWHACGAPTGTFVLARLLAATATAAGVALPALAASWLWLGVQVANWPAALGWVLACASCWYLIMLHLQILAGSARRGQILTSFVLFPSMLTGGSMLPFQMMPEGIAAAGKATPLGWMTANFDLILRGQATAGQVTGWLVMVCAASLALLALSGVQLRRKFLRG
ncbi:MAG: ABC transporter permease [Acidobacteria bacterium]|nr:ABC transporter permease [Acidobacteriota bacterium]